MEIHPANPGWLFSPDGKWLTGLANGTVQIWQVPHGRQEGQLPVGDVNGMAFSSEAKTSGHGGKIIAAASQDVIRLYSARCWFWNNHAGSLGAMVREKIPAIIDKGPIPFLRDSNQLAAKPV